MLEHDCADCGFATDRGHSSSAHSRNAQGTELKMCHQMWHWLSYNAENYFHSVKPEFVAPLVLYLCHESSTKTGGLFECGGGWAGELRHQRAVGGIFMGPNSPASVENVSNAFGTIVDFNKVTYPTSSTESSMGLMEQSMRVDAGEGPDVSAWKRFWQYHKVPARPNLFENKVRVWQKSV